MLVVLLAAMGWGFVAGVWMAAFLIVGVHEAGHAYAARRLGIPTSTLVIGIGPEIAQGVWRGLHVEVRAIPVVGWVEMQQAEPPMGSLRQAAVYGAGPIASLLFSVVVALGAVAWFQGPANVGAGGARQALQTSAEGAWSVFVMPFDPVVGLLDAGSAAEVHGEVAHGTSGRFPAAPKNSPGEGDREIVTIVGLTSSAPAQMAEHGAGWVFAAVAAVSAGVAGLNLLPAWGLDGHGILEEAASRLGRRGPRWTRCARGLLSVVGVITAALGAWVVLGALAKDVAGLL